MTLTVNDEAKVFSEGITLHALLVEMNLEQRKGLAVAVNESVVPAASWQNHCLTEGDKVLLIQATQGG